MKNTVNFLWTSHYLYSNLRRVCFLESFKQTFCGFNIFNLICACVVVFLAAFYLCPFVMHLFSAPTVKKWKKLYAKQNSCFIFVCSQSFEQTRAHLVFSFPFLPVYFAVPTIICVLVCILCARKGGQRYRVFFVCVVILLMIPTTTIHDPTNALYFSSSLKITAINSVHQYFMVLAMFASIPQNERSLKKETKQNCFENRN